MITDPVIVGYGARTPIGLSADSTAAALRAGISAYNDHPYMIGANGLPMITAMDALLQQDVEGDDRIVNLTISAATEAIGLIRQFRGKSISVDLMLGLPCPRPGFSAADGERIGSVVRLRLNDLIAVRSIHIDISGNAGGFTLAERAMTILANGNSDFCLLGGADSYLDSETLEWLDDRCLLHSMTNTHGFVPGEGAAFVLLTTATNARRLNLKVLGRLLSAATDDEPTTNKIDAICLGEGLTRAVSRTLDSLPSDGGKVSYSICDINGEIYRGTEWGYTLVRLSDRFVDATCFLTPADCWGDVGAASGSLFMVISVISAAKEYSPGQYVLLWTSSECGKRSAALVQTYRPEEDKVWA